MIGLTAADGAALVVPYLASLMRIKEYILLGDRIPASLALELGLVTRVLPKADVLPRSMDVARRLATLPPRACQETTRLLNRPIVANVLQTIDHALASESECFLTDDHQTALEPLRKRVSRS
jgi:enoyl-CoA hydratase